jgi:hypothetical protein
LETDHPKPITTALMAAMLALGALSIGPAVASTDDDRNISGNKSTVVSEVSDRRPEALDASGLYCVSTFNGAAPGLLDLLASDPRLHLVANKRRSATPLPTGNRRNAGICDP